MMSVSTAAVVWHLWLNYSNKYDLCVGKIQINMTAHFPNSIATSYRRTECIIRTGNQVGCPGVATSRNWTTWSDTGNLEQEMRSNGVKLSALIYSGIQPEVWGHLTLIQVRAHLLVPVFSEQSPRTSRDGDTAFRTRCPRCLLKRRQIGNLTTLSVSVPCNASNSMFTMCRAYGGMISGRGNRGTQRKTTTIQSHSLCLGLNSGGREMPANNRLSYVIPVCV
jgi:hypothetical protein